MRIETVAGHGGHQSGAHPRAVGPRIDNATPYGGDGLNPMENRSASQLPDGFPHPWPRPPAQDVLEQRMAAMERGIGGLAVASGEAAIVCSAVNITEAGDNLVASGNRYSGSSTLLAQALPPFGVELRCADGHDIDGLARLIDCKTRALFCESVGDPSGEVADLSALAQLAQHHGVPLIVDNTVPSPYLCRPIEHGADIVVHSLTQYIGGGSGLIGGLIVDSGKFPWAEHKEKYRRLTEPDRAGNGMVFTGSSGPHAYLARARAIPPCGLGTVIAMQAALSALQGLATLPVRMDRICDNALALAEYLGSHRLVTWICYAALPSHPDKPLTEAYIGGRASGILSFGIKGGREACARFIDALDLVLCLANPGDMRSLALHPASSTHRHLSSEDRKKAAITDDMIKMSVGLEHIDDIVDDIDRALELSQSAA